MSVHVVRGDDPDARVRQLRTLVTELVKDDDRSLAVEEHTVPGREGGVEERTRVAAAAATAAASPPFGTSVRVVVLREIGALTAEDASPLVEYLASPLETTELVLVGGGGRLPASITKALKSAGAEQHAARSGATRDQLVHELRTAGLSLTEPARRRVEEHLAEDAARVPELVEVLRASAGGEAQLDEEDVVPYLGELGTVKPWELTNAIEAGDISGAVAVLHRLLHATGGTQAKPMHPLQVMAMLHNSVRRLMRVDDPEIVGEADAAAALTELTGRSVKPYPARKALDQARAWGSEGLRRAVDLLARADLDLRGASALPGAAVLEVLVARLAGIAARGRPRGRSGGRRPRRRSPS